MGEHDGPTTSRERPISALTLILLRHAEKPKRDFPGPGLTPEGEKDKESLVVRGWQRAGAWAALFGAGLGGEECPRPNLVYAADPNGTSDDTSQRPYETALPLADRLGLRPIVTFAVGDEAKLVEEIEKLTGVVLVCWEHKAIVAEIVPRLLAGQSLPGVPDKWEGGRFDVALRFDRALPGSPWSFRQLSPRLLSADSDLPVAQAS